MVSRYVRIDCDRHAWPVCNCRPRVRLIHTPTRQPQIATFGAAAIGAEFLMTQGALGRAGRI